MTWILEMCLKPYQCLPIYIETASPCDIKQCSNYMAEFLRLWLPFLAEYGYI